MIHPTHQLSLPKQYLDKLPSSDISVRYRNSDKPITIGLWQKVKIFFGIGTYYNELQKFYPYHPVIKNSAELYQEDVEKSIKKGLIASLLSIFTIYQAARLGIVLPIFKKYGSIFNTHRIFRQYATIAVFPFLLFLTLTNYEHYSNVVQLWSVHARRLQQGILTDPDGTNYPEHVLPVGLGNAWITPYISPTDLQAKRENEVKLENAPEYTNPEFEPIDISESEAGEDQSEE